MLPLTQVDVFAQRFLEGNPVAVVHDAEELTGERMQAFARWTNLSETTFLLPPTVPGADYRLRIFTTEQELPFAGHPTLGSARAWLEAGGAPAGADLVQQCAAGLVTVRRSGDRLAFAEPPLVRGGPVDRGDVDRLTGALGVDPADVLDTRWVDNGPGWVGLLLRDAATVLALEPDRTRFGDLRDVGVVGAQPEGSETDFEVRAFMAQGSGEDPVTGSLNASLAGWLMRAGHAPQAYTAAQGTRLGRRGRVHLTRVDDVVWTGGDTVVGIRGQVDL